MPDRPDFFDALIGSFKEAYEPRKLCNAEKFILGIDEDKPKEDITIEDLIEILK